MIKAVVNGQTYEIKEESKNIYLNGEIYNWDLINSGHRYHIIYNHQSYNAEVLSTDFISKKLIVKINGHSYEVDIKDQMDILLSKLGMSQNASTTLKEIKAPMPGLILHIHVKERMEVKKGDPIMILEAMKMENIIKSPGDGTIKSVKVKTGNSVEKNQILIDFD